MRKTILYGAFVVALILVIINLLSVTGTIELSTSEKWLLFALSCGSALLSVISYCVGRR